MKRFKKLLLIGLFVLSSLCFCSCDLSFLSQYKQNESGGASQYTVTFEQNGVETIVKTVESGKALTDIPTPQVKTGYTVAWDRADFSAITKNMTVRAIETPKKYTVVFEENGGEELSVDTFTVEYDSVYSLPQPTHTDGLIFKGWYAGETSVQTSGIWRADNNESVTFTAAWQCSITFQQGASDKIFYVDYGGAFTDIPEIENAPLGVESHWSVSDFSNVTENITVTVIYEAKEFSICLDWNDGSGKKENVTVTYGENYSLDIPSKLGHTFVCWTYNGEEIPLSGVWNIGGENIILKAKWKNNAEDGDWTPSH